MRYFLLLFLIGCSTLKQDVKNVDKAAIRHPDMLAKKARDLFPCVTTKGDTIFTTDSAMYQAVLDDLQNQYYEMYLEKDSLNKVLDGMKDDTLATDMIDALREVISQRDKKIELILNKVGHIPPVIKTITIHDTTVDNAAVRVCEFDKSKVIALLESKTAENDSWHKKAKNRFWVILIMGAIIGVGAYIKIAGIFKPKTI